MKTTLAPRLALALLGVALGASELHAQLGDSRAPVLVAVEIPGLIESPACAVDATEARLILDRAARHDGDAALDYLTRVRDSLEAEVSPRDADALFVLAAVRGVEATLQGGKAQVRAAEAAFRHSRRVLELEPDHAGAAYVLGRLNAGVMRTGRLTRFLASRLMGAEALGDASWDEARRLLEIAVEARPCDPEYRYELARVYAHLGLLDRAVEQLDRAVDSPDRGPRARSARADARVLRDRLRAEGTGS